MLFVITLQEYKIRYAFQFTRIHLYFFAHSLCHLSSPQTKPKTVVTSCLVGSGLVFLLWLVEPILTGLDRRFNFGEF